MNDNDKKWDIAARIAVIVFFAALFFSLTVPVTDPDFWWHLATGKWMVENRSLMGHDPFLMRLDLQEILQNPAFILKQYWLAQLLFYGVYSLAGIKAVVVLCAAVYTAMFLALYLLLRGAGMNRLFSMLGVQLAIVVIVSEFGYIGAKPQMWSSLFTILLILLLELLRQGKQWAVPVIPALMLLWSNMHGGFVLGALILAIYAVGALFSRSGTRQFYALCGISLLCCGMNPNGYTAFISTPVVGPVLTLLGLSSQQQVKSIMDAIAETQSIFEHASLAGIMRSLPYFTGLVILSLASFAANIRNLGRLRKDHLLLFLLVLLMGLRSIRFIIFFVGIASFLTAVNLKLFFSSFALPKFNASQSITHGLTLAVALFFSTAYAQAGVRNTALAAENASAHEYSRVAGFIQQAHLRGNLFNDYTPGGFLIWSLYPDVKVFIDGRALSPTAFNIFRDTMARPTAFMPGPDVPVYQHVLNTFSVDMVLIPGCDRVSGTLIHLADTLANDTRWALAYADTTALLFVRDTPENEEFLKQHRLPNRYVYMNILENAAEASRSSHARMMPNWKLALAAAYRGLGDVPEARKWLNEYLRAVPSDAYALALRGRM